MASRALIQSTKSVERVSQTRSPFRHETRTNRDREVAKSTQSQSVKVEYASALGAEHYPKTLVTKWVDYSSKYGIGYKMSNGCYGVLFNDSTKMVLNQNSFHFAYIRRESYSKENIENLTSFHTFADYPPSLKKKVVLIQHFKGYLDGVKFEPDLAVPHPEPVEAQDKEGKQYFEMFLKKWKRAKKAVLFRLSNRVIQVSFQDSSELILASGSGSVTFITARKEIKTTPLYSDLEKHDPSLFKRLNYAKEILLNMIHPSKDAKRDKTAEKFATAQSMPFKSSVYSSNVGDSGATPMMKSRDLASSPHIDLQAKVVS